MNLIHNQDTYNHSLQVVIGNKLIVIETIDDTLDLHNKNIRSIWVRTIIDLHTTTLDISNNSLTFFPDIFSLKYVDCSNCQIKEMPVYMPVLEELNCANNLITELPKYPKLVSLNCSNNPLTVLPSYDHIKLIANNCPIFVLHDNPAYYQRSGVIRGGKFQWIRTSILENKYTIIDWQNAKTTLKFSTKFTKKLSRFLFYPSTT